jgi:CheY-like chemotaxis protein
MTGIDVLKSFRAMDSFKNIPILAVTAFAMRGDREAFLAEGFDDYLSKPFSKESLLNLVRSKLI